MNAMRESVDFHSTQPTFSNGQKSIEVNLVDAYLENASLINTNLTKSKLCNTTMQDGSVNVQNCR
ncbi:MAG: hypothetical protein DCF20_18055 [Pseudanabaena sp.]|nr:MAG: hypothetical protein DCF20_18055 [Pseudanabaena sp.]